MTKRRPRLAVLLLLASGCSAPPGGSPRSPLSPVPYEVRPTAPEADPARLEPSGCTIAAGYPALGAYLDGDRLVVRARSTRATRIEVELYRGALDEPPVLRRALQREGDEIFSQSLLLAEIPGDGTLFYGLRAFGPNWPYDPAWQPGSMAGFVAHVDDRGNRFNPNKLLLDPYALEMTHDPLGPRLRDGSIFRSGPDAARDSGPVAPKGIVLARPPRACHEKPDRSFADGIIYEVHVRGLTMNDPSVPEAWRGTFRGAAEKAAYLAELGVTAIELMPIQETQNDQNDLENGTNGDNYWGYSSLSFFAPDRRYAFDKSPGGPTRELQEMVRAFHAADIEVYLDVVFNHTGEGGGDGDTASILSFRGLDNAGYYLLADDARRYAGYNGVGPDVAGAHPIARDLILDALRYLTDVIGVDGFRFDLAAVLGNGCDRACFRWDATNPQGILRRAAEELPGTDLIAEPWGIGGGSYQQGNFPAGWAEWDGRFKDTVRSAQNQLGVAPVTPRELGRRLLGSSDLFGDDGRSPAAAVNYLDSHDGFTLADLYRYDDKQNDQPWPNGPSQGGDDYNRSWDQGGDPSRQRQAARTGLALLALSAGVPMIVGGDEMLRTQYGNNNPYNLDSPTTWLDWSLADTNARFLTFARALFQFRRDHPMLRSRRFPVAAQLFTDAGAPASDAYLDDPTRHYLAVCFSGGGPEEPAASIYVAYNGWSETLAVTLPAPEPGMRWRRVGDTAAWMEPDDNLNPAGRAYVTDGRRYDLVGRSLVWFVEEP